MSKPNHPRMLADTQAESIVRNLRVSPRKLNLVAASIRNQKAGTAVASLTFSKRRIAGEVKKALQSAIANAENNHQLDVDRLVVTIAEVGRGIVMRRFMARGRGKSSRIEKWFSHLRIVVAERAEAPVTPHVPRTARKNLKASVPPVAAAAEPQAVKTQAMETQAMETQEGAQA